MDTTLYLFINCIGYTSSSGFC